MSETRGVRQEREAVASGAETSVQLAGHVAQQPASIQRTHKLMLALEAAIVIAYIGLFVAAVYVSVTWKRHGELAVPRWWMVSQVGAALFMAIMGLHALIVKAYPPIPFSGDNTSAVTGRRAATRGRSLIGLGILWAIAWGGMYVGIVLSGEEPLRVFIPVVVILSISIGVISGIRSAIQRWAKPG